MFQDICSRGEPLCEAGWQNAGVSQILYCDMDLDEACRQSWTRVSPPWTPKRVSRLQEGHPSLQDISMENVQ